MAAYKSIAGVIARQVGTLQGDLVTQVETRVLESISKFEGKCPTTNELRNIIKLKNNLSKVVRSFSKRLTSLNSFSKKLNIAIKATRVGIVVIKSIPIPTAIIPPATGGIGIPINILTRYSDALIQLNKLLDGLEADKVALDAITSTASSIVPNLLNRLASLDSLIEECSKTSPDTAALVEFSQPKENTGSEGIPNLDYTYKGFTLLIIEDPNSPAIAPKRFAVAKDVRGVIMLQGESSFSADTQVLLDEIKFRIDNQLS